VLQSAPDLGHDDAAGADVPRFCEKGENAERIDSIARCPMYQELSLARWRLMTA